MVDFFVMMIRNNSMTYEDVPDKFHWREDVAKALKGKDRAM